MGPCTEVTLSLFAEVEQAVRFGSDPPAEIV